MLRGLFLLACGCTALPAAGVALPAGASAPSSPAAHETAVKAASPPPPVGSASAHLVPSSVDPETLDSVGALTLRPMPDGEEKTPAFIRHVEDLRSRHDETMAVSYLRSVVVNDAGISARDRARAILELADSLGRLHRPGETLCWLKIWMQLFPDRPETAAVAYRMGTIYTHMGLPGLARDSYYLALSRAINQGQVQTSADLKQYQRLTNGTLWALAANEYQAGAWARAAELLDRYRKEASTASRASLETEGFLQADCYYQLHERDKAAAAYTQALARHPFHVLAPEARLRLYHLDLLAHQPAQAQQELQALVWTVRTAFPTQEEYWQKRTAELLLALNRRDGAALPPLLARSVRLQTQDKAWQGELEHYDRLVKFETATTGTGMPGSPAASTTTQPATGWHEEADLLAMQRAIDDLAPAKIALSPTVSAAHP